MGVKIHGEEDEGLVSFEDLQKGQIGEVVTAGGHRGKIVCGLWEGAGQVVSLDGGSWDSLGTNTLKVRLLPKGTLLEVT